VTMIRRVEVKGKHGNKVAILIPKAMKESLDILFLTRSDIGVPMKNKYVFANIHSRLGKPLRACVCMHHFAGSCGAVMPHNLTSTKLRKHLATMTQVLNLKDNELDIVAKFLGHNIAVHREFYRLPQNTVEIAKVGKLLFAMNRGQMDMYAGKSLDDIKILDNGKIYNCLSIIVFF
jgi:hypothetical protein